MSRNIKLAPGELYHLYNRGTEKRKIFMRKSDYDRFLVLLYLCNSTRPVRIDDLTQGRTLRELFTDEREETLIDLCAYCLMPNHFHLLVREKVENGISRFMQKLLTAFTMYFNTRHERAGALFQGKYQARHVDDDRYLKYLLSYIHLNPVKLIEPQWKEIGITNHSRAEKWLENYWHSSFPDYNGNKRIERRILNMSALKEYYDCTAPSDFKKSVTEWLDYQPLSARSNLA
ncbi:MAG: transposase [Candidatus Vogelbacteria bacterium]